MVEPPFKHPYRRTDTDAPTLGATNPDRTDAQALLAELAARGIKVRLGRNGFDLVTRPSVRRVPRVLFEHIVAAQDALRATLRGE